MHLKSIILYALATGFTVDSILRTMRSNFNFGLFLIYCITAFLWIYGFFNKQIDAFCTHGLGLVIKIAFLCGCAFLFFMLAFITISGNTDRAVGEEKAIIVLGAGLRGETVSGVLQRRLDAAYDFYVQYNTSYIVVSGGRGPDELIPEAVAMKKYLIARGVPENNILEESKSTSTEENFLFSKELLAKHGIGAGELIAFSTNNFHCYRSKKYAEKSGFTNVNIISASTGLSSILPCYLREVFAILYYWVFRR